MPRRYRFVDEDELPAAPGEPPVLGLRLAGLARALSGIRR